jgi:hypothetical protein
MSRFLERLGREEKCAPEGVGQEREALRRWQELGCDPAPPRSELRPELARPTERH